MLDEFTLKMCSTCYKRFMGHITKKTYTEEKKTICGLCNKIIGIGFQHYHIDSREMGMIMNVGDFDDYQNIIKHKLETNIEQLLFLSVKNPYITNDKYDILEHIRNDINKVFDQIEKRF